MKASCSTTADRTQHTSQSVYHDNIPKGSEVPETFTFEVPVNALIRLLFPTLLLPIKAISGFVSGGNEATLCAPAKYSNFDPNICIRISTDNNISRVWNNKTKTHLGGVLREAVVI